MKLISNIEGKRLQHGVGMFVWNLYFALTHANSLIDVLMNQVFKEPIPIQC